MAVTKNTLKVTMARTRVTKGAVMFEAPEGTKAVTNLYLRKDGLEALGATEDTTEIEVTISAK